MRKEIRKSYKQFMLITMSGIKHIITEPQYEILLRSPEKSKIIINGNQVNSSSISDVVELNEYYCQHPEERPVPVHSEDVRNLPPPRIFNKKQKIQALESILSGIDKFISQNPNSPNATMIRNRISSRIEKTKQDNEEETTLDKIIKF